MGDVDWVNFLTKAALIVIRYMAIGAIILGGIGVLVAVAASIFGNADPFSWAYVAGIAWNYAKIGLFGGGIIGLLYGLLTQGTAL
jgi:hypothetical protein